MNWESILAQALTLVVVFDPIGNAPVVLGLLQKVAPERRRHILMREMLFVLALLLVIYFAGSTVLGMLGISRSSLTLTGGIMLFLIAIGLIFPSVNVMRQTGDDEVDAEPFIVPLVVPLIVGPAAISIIMLNSSLCTGFTDRLAGILSLLLAWLIQSSVLLCSGSLLSRLGHKGIVSVTRLMGMILVLIAVQMILNGITDYIENLHIPGAEPLAPAALPTGAEAAGSAPDSAAASSASASPVGDANSLSSPS